MVRNVFGGSDGGPIEIIYVRLSKSLNLTKRQGASSNSR